MVHVLAFTSTFGWQLRTQIVIDSNNGSHGVSHAVLVGRANLIIEQRQAALAAHAERQRQRR